MDVMALFTQKFQVFLVVWARMTAVVFLAPMFSFPVLPDRLKLILAFLVTLAIFPWVSQSVPPLPTELGLFALIVIKEALVGMLLGFFGAIVFSAFTLSTQFFSTQIGLGMSQVLDPITQEEQPLLSVLFSTMSLLVFVGMGGMHLLLRGVVDSYQLIPALDLMNGTKPLLEMALKYFALLFVASLQISFPVIAAGSVITVGLALMGRAAPNMNIMMLGLPIQLGLGLVVLLIALPGMLTLFGRLYENSVSDVVIVLTKMASGAKP